MSQPQATTSNGQGPRPLRRGALKAFKVLLCIVGGLVGLLIVANILAAISEARRAPTVFEHVTRDEANRRLPAGATDVSGVRVWPADPYDAHECRVSEEEFVRWAQDRDWPVEEIGPKPYKIYRYKWVVDSKALDAEAVITNGLFHQWRGEGRGRYVAFDRDKQRAYFMYHRP